MDNQRDRAIANAISLLLVLLLVVTAWLLLDRFRRQADSDPDLNTIVFLAAAANLIVVGRLILSAHLRSTHRGLKVLCIATVLTSVVSCALVDYGALRRSGPALPTVLVVSIVLSLFRKRR